MVPQVKTERHLSARPSQWFAAFPWRLVIVLVAAIAVPRGACATEDALPLSADEVKRRWHSRLDGQHFQAEILMEMELAGLRESRRLRVFRVDEGSTRERVLIRFESPPDLRGVGILYLENEDRPNDYFLYTPETRRVRRLPETAVTDEIYGIDAEFLGFGVARTVRTKAQSITREEIFGRPAFRLVERALNPNRRFHERVTWVDSETFIPLRTEHIRDGRIVLSAETRQVSSVQGVPTPRHMGFDQPLKGRRVELYVEAVDYRKEISEDVFSVLSLVKMHLE